MTKLERRRQARTCYLSGATRAEIAARLGVSPTYVNVLLRESRERGELTPEDDAAARRALLRARAQFSRQRIERAASLYQMGLAPEAIAQELTCSLIAFRKLLNKARRLGFIDEGMRRRAIVDARRQEILETYLPIFEQAGTHPPSSSVRPRLLSAIYRYFFTLIRFRIAFDQLYVSSAP